MATTTEHQIELITIESLKAAIRKASDSVESVSVTLPGNYAELLSPKPIRASISGHAMRDGSFDLYGVAVHPLAGFADRFQAQRAKAQADPEAYRELHRYLIGGSQ